MRLLASNGVLEIAADEVGDRLARDGYVLISQASAAEVSRLLKDWTRPVDHPHQSQPGVTVIDPSRAPADGLNAVGFTRTALLPHTDRSLHLEPPSLLASLTVVPAASGGDGVVVDGAHVAAQLRDQFGAEVLAKLSLSAPGRERAQAIFGSRDGYQRIRYRDDEIAWPCHPDRAAQITARLRQLIKGASVPLTLGQGDGYLLHNHRTLHGRSAFTGRRCVIRFLATVEVSHPYAWLNKGFDCADS